MSYQGNHERGAVSYIVASLGQRKPEVKKKRHFICGLLESIKRCKAHGLAEDALRFVYF